ncbi:ketoacyl-synt-domain-containing protein [Aspergillus sclerotiicarbonarius CBS 121057]|uniref:Ketoacyl-synt-domain-containing protein n=1 Tax=Aspergillus sclerotiicarbonarius (strain CBS 121057 / IBT 28362) TaxID=1448318 RepID=A0A319F769_ASPSB|nr:ketoacyl-synt-domain-containing protein [Aspergillus sclerotiicarbonarius CBS 121057]
MPTTHQDPVMPIAVIGIGGRFPGNASSPEKLWEVLLNGDSTLSETPKDRFNIDAFYHPHAERSGTQSFRGGHFMNRPIDAFDAPFFSITPNEAKAIDPQQRMCLEVAYEAMENGKSNRAMNPGVTLQAISGTNTCCYFGSFNHDYQKILDRDPYDVPFYGATGTEAAAIANRISWFYDLVGPSVTVDTACSSSLVGLHLACQSLRTGESDMALVGGVNLISTPENNLTMSTFHFLSPDSKSQAFDEKANGYGRGEGTCCLVLKPLNKAIQEKNVIRAVIRNTGCNQDGNTPGLTQPSRSSQKNLILRAYQDAGLDLADTGYFEAHGTGTTAGDSTETRVLGETIGRARPPGKPLWMGSVKDNIGHLEGASGLAGMVKAIYILESGKIPPQIWFQKPNPRILLQEWNLAVPTELMDWPYDGARRISVNSFGFAGANAHAILEDASSYLSTHGLEGCHHTTNANGLHITSHKVISDRRMRESPDSGYNTSNSVEESTAWSGASPKLIVLSAYEESGLKRTLDAWMDYLDNKASQIPIAEWSPLVENFAYTAATGRTRFPWKSFIVLSSPRMVTERKAIMASPIRSSRRLKIAFVFTGQGAQYHGMGHSLMAYEEYTKSINSADTYLKSLGCPWSLKEELLRNEQSSRVNNPEYSQPLCTAVQVALVDLLRSIGISPVAVAGHSGGETAAAYAKEAITAEAAWKIAYHRGKLSGILSTIRPEAHGAMLAASISKADIFRYIDRVTKGDIVVACVNSPSSVTLSGDAVAIAEIEKILKEAGIVAKQVKVNIAYHSPHMEIVASRYRELLGSIEPLPGASGEPIMFSSVSGSPIENGHLGSEYWVKNLLCQVRFGDAIQALASYSSRRSAKKAPDYCYVDAIVEVGPHGVLQTPIKQTLTATGAKCDVLSVLDRREDPRRAFLEAVGLFFQRGYEADIVKANRNTTPAQRLQILVDLPPFPWNHSNRYWHESAISANFRFKEHPRKDLLGVRDNEGNPSQPRWRQFLRLSENPWMAEHVVDDRILYPAAGMLAMALEAARETGDPGRAIDAYELRDVVIRNPLIVSRTGDGPETMIHFQHRSPGTRTRQAPYWQEFNIYSRITDQSWTHHCSGLVRIQYMAEECDSLSSVADDQALWNEKHRTAYHRTSRGCQSIVPPQQFYNQLAEHGLQLGEAFQNHIEIRRNQTQVVSAVQIPDISRWMPGHFTHNHLIHPCTLDSFIQISMTIIGENMQGEGLALPVSIGKLWISNAMPAEPGTVLRAYSDVKAHGLRSAQMDLYASTNDWERPLIAMKELTMTRTTGNSDAGGDGARRIVSRMHWQEDVSHLDGQRLVALCTAPGKNETTMRNPLLMFMRLLGHKYPDLNILETRAEDEKITEQILDALQAVDGERTPWFKHYTVATMGEARVAMFNGKFQAWAPYFKAFDSSPAHDSEHHDMPSHDYDCIIMHYSGRGDDDAITRARTVLKDRGTLVIVNRNLALKTESEWTNELRKSRFRVEFSVIDNPAQQSSFTPFMVITATEELESPMPESILIVDPPGESVQVHNLSASVSSIFHKQGVPTSHTSLYETKDIDLSTQYCIVLADLARPILFDIAPKSFLILKRLLLEAAGVCWVTSGTTFECARPQAALMIGLSRTIRQEQPDVNLTTVDLDWPNGDKASDACAIVNVVSECSRGDIDREFAVRYGRLMIPRIRLDRALNGLTSAVGSAPRKEPGLLKQPDRGLTVALSSPGILNTIYFRDDPLYNKSLATNDVEIEVKASGVNFLDTMVALDQVSERTIGMECSGVVCGTGSAVTKFKSGDRVLTLKLGSFSTFVRSPECMVHPVPADMTFETAASIPVNYVTAYQALVETSGLQRGESILIHGAAGGVGQAAIMMAKVLKAEIFATVGSQNKKDHLQQTHAIPEDHIFNSRDLSFASGIDRLTRGRGVDVVLNSLEGEGLRQSWLRVAPFGRFVELGKRDILENTGLDMSPFIRGVSFHSVNVLGLYQQSLPRAAQALNNALRFYHDRGCRPASPIQVMSYSEISQALQRLASGQTVGKVVLKATDRDVVMTAPPPVPPIQFVEAATYVIVGGMGGIGQYIALWMADHGARHFLFLSRQGADHSDASAVFADLSAKGAQAMAYQCDISDEEQVGRAFRRCSLELPPVKGIMQAAMLLSDATFRQMTPQQWYSGINTKAMGTWNLHCAAPAGLDFFVMLSSVSGVIGWRGQGNYAASNTFLDALAYHRRAQGFPGVSIDVGSVFDVGYMAQKPELKRSLQQQGLIGIKGEELLCVLQAALRGGGAQNGTTCAQWILGVATGGWAAGQGLNRPYYHAAAKMGHLREIGAVDHRNDGTRHELRQSLGKARSQESAIALISDALRDRLAQQLGVPVANIDASKPVSGYGVDSLTAVEIRAWGIRDLQADISILDIANTPSVWHLATILVRSSGLTPRHLLEEP